MFLITVLAQQLHAPTELHFVLAKRERSHVPKIVNWASLYPKRTECSSALDTYADTDWSKSKDTELFTTGTLAKINKAPIF